ncbi:hypothetical protein [Flavobacterium subsaxonicum]|uniref:Uncharacterized protein n=1 Tax=Flavobacterium subsaxonicum WB 4.1-42 = DSM 21790 TaxID=1121898 RepID=A0A0A2MKT7_9FLAO|nr:hypothetical protein [Flavobacterium subsaxonicum]KGO93242.1 hypothetical protein Q766_08015 [Flavobacterium subsaxonicum WB 4.1-42 = DSM 21790]
MKNINRMNYFITGIPPILLLAGWLFASSVWMIGALLTMVTGAFHIVVGIGLCIETNGKPIYLIYLLGVALFFILWIITNWENVVYMPPILATYMSVLLFIKAKLEKL